MVTLEPETPQVALKPNPRNDPTMFKIFQNVQFNVVQHKKYVKEMTKLYRKMETEAFRESFTNALFYLFTFGDTSANVDRVIQFVATFCTSLEDEDELLYICELIFKCQCVSGQSVRYRASQLLAAVLSALGDDASLDDDLCDKLLYSQTNRLQDTRGAVRCRAALALQRLQNPMDNDDPVTRAYRFHMSCDPSASVRRAVVMSIAKCIRNARFVQERLCDVDEAVRRAAFLYIAAINVTQLKVKQRVYILKVGLNERSPRVRRVVEEILIPGWLAAFHGNIIDLLKAIRLDNSQDAQDSMYVAGKLLHSLFMRLPTSELLEWLPTDKTLRLIPAEKLNKETAWYWRHLAAHLQAKDDDETLESVLPDLVVLAGYIRTIVEAPCPSETEDPVGFNTRQHVLAELSRLLKVYDAGDPVGRNMLQKLITDALTGDHGPLNPEVISAFVSALEMVIPEVSTRIELVTSIIADLREPESDAVVEPAPQIECTEIKLQRARLRVSLNVALEAQEEAVREQNYALASECKDKVEDIQRKLDSLVVQPATVVQPQEMPVDKELVSNAQTLKKCLLILNSALDTPQITTVTPQLRLLFNELELELFKNPEILETALETIALYSMLDLEIAKENKSFFFAHISRVEDESLMTTILKCIIDILSVHGLKVFDPETESAPKKCDESKSSSSNADITELDDLFSDSLMKTMTSTVIEILLNIMDGTHTSYRLIIAEGLCRLLILGHLESPGIVSRLILLWFNPNTEEEDLLRQTIGVFFQTFPVTVDGAQEQIQKATIPTLRALVHAPASSPISEIDQEAVVRFIVSMTKVNHEIADSQGALAMLLVTYLMKKPNSSEASLICKMLSLLTPPRDVAICVDLSHTLRDICLKLPDKQSSRNLTRYLGALEASERMSLNKMSSGATMTDSVATEDMSRLGRITTSLPQPIARSTHVVINQTVPEEVEIDETSPDAMEQPTTQTKEILASNGECTSPKRTTRTSITSIDSSSSSKSSISPKDIPSDKSPCGEVSDSSSSGVSPVKKPRGNTNDNKKKGKHRSRADAESKSSDEKIVQEDKPDAPTEQVRNKRSRSQRSNESGDAALEAKSSTSSSKSADNQTSEPSTSKSKNTKTEKTKPKKALEAKSSSSSSKSADSQSAEPITSKTKNTKTENTKPKKGKKAIEPAKPMQTRLSESTRFSEGLFSDSEEELHTIVYDQENEQQVLEASDIEDDASKSVGHVTIPETPEGSDDSEEPEPKPVQTKSKKGTKK